MILPDMQLLLTPFASLHLQMMNSPLSMLKLMQINNFTQQQGLPISACSVVFLIKKPLSVSGFLLLISILNFRSLPCDEIHAFPGE